MSSDFLRFVFLETVRRCIFSIPPIEGRYPIASFFLSSWSGARHDGSERASFKTREGVTPSITVDRAVVAASTKDVLLLYNARVGVVVFELLRDEHVKAEAASCRGG
ncbi:hypothetical protein MTO96_014581 [Rhipicephalus appendiculatus]